MNGKLTILADLYKLTTFPARRDAAIAAAQNVPIVADDPLARLADVLHPEVFSARIERIDTLGFTRRYWLRCDRPIYFRAGQYLSLRLSVGKSRLTRAYSICSSPAQGIQCLLAIAVEGVPGGFASQWIHDTWQVGTTVCFVAPCGDAVYEPLRDPTEIVALAGGSGITPYLSMAQAVADGTEPFRLTILYGNQNYASALFADELAALCSSCDRLRIIHVLQDERREGCEHGIIDAEIIQKYAPQGSRFFICGTGDFCIHVLAELASLGVAPEAVRHDPLPPSPAAKTQQAAVSLSVRQGNTETTVPARTDEPLLVALERAGLYVPSRCRGGSCGWCRTKLLSGDVFCPPENDGRRRADREYGYIHPCSCFPRSDLSIELPG